MPLRERLFAKIKINPDGCWLWLGCRSNGYGQIRDRGRARLAHRVMYELLIGKIPDGLHVDHLCRVPLCVNPQHLEPVTQRENILRGVGVSAMEAKKTHCPKGHPYSGDNLSVWRNKRYCRACAREYDKRRRPRKVRDKN